jgi:hypothetical protein
MSGKTNTKNIFDARKFPLLPMMLVTLLTVGLSFAVTYISSCGTPAGGWVSGATYALTSDVSSGSTCFNVGSDDTIINCQGHTISGALHYYGILLSGSRDQVINCNIIASPEDHAAIGLGGQSWNGNHKIINCNLSGAWDGYFNDKAGGNQIINSRLSGSYYGAESAGDSIINSTATGGSGGIYIINAMNAVDNQVINTTATGPVGIKIIVYAAATIRNSTIIGTSTGIDLSSAYDNGSSSTGSIIINNIIRAPTPVVIGGISTNTWNDANGGNYWTNPSNTGFSNTCTNIGGICSASLTLPSGNVDSKPLAVLPSWARTAAPPEPTCPDSMVGYWKGDGNANDEKGLNNGTWTGTIAYNPNGKVGQAFDLNGANYIDLGNSASLQLQTFTAIAWVKSSNTSINTDNYIVGYVPADHNYYGEIWSLRSAGGQFGSLMWSNGWADLRFGTFDTAWHQLAITYDGSTETETLYVDGANVNSMLTSIHPYTPSGYYGMRIGAYAGVGCPSCPSNQWNGQIDEVALFNTALSQPEIQQLYNNSLQGIDYCERAGAPPSPCPDGLVSYWRFNDSTSPYADSIGGNNGHCAAGSCPWTANGKVGGALDFDANSYVLVPSANSVRPSLFSVSFWVKLKNDVTDPQYIFVEGINGMGYKIYLASPNTLVFVSEDNTPGGGGTIITPINVGEWIYVTLTRNTTNMSIYKNGVVAASMVPTVGVQSYNPTDLYIGGSSPWYTGRLSNIVLDELALFNRPLSTTEIQSLYNGGAGKDYCSAGAPPNPNLIYNSTGGTVEDQGITVTIPQGVLGTTELLVDIVPSTHSFAPTIGITNVSPLLDIGPQCTDIEDESTCGETNGCRWNELAMCESIPFLSPVTIEMPGDCSGTYGDLTSQKIAKYNIISGTPEPVSTCDPEDIGGGIYSCQEMDGRTMAWDTNTCMISVQVWSFSTYAVIKQEPQCPDGMVSYWNANENTNDALGSNTGVCRTAYCDNPSCTEQYTCENDCEATWHDDNSLCTYVAGKFGQAFSFNGNQYMKFNNGVNLNGDASYTVSLWAKPNALSQTALFSFARNEVYYGSVILGSDSSGYIGAWHYANDNLFSQSWIANQWQHVTLTYDSATSTESLYVNGEFKESWNPIDLDLSSSNNLWLGTLGWGWDYYNGAIDEVAIYNRALLQAEIQANMNKAELCTTAPTPTCPDGMVSYWTFDDSNSIGKDSKGANDCISQGSYTWNSQGRLNGALLLSGSGYLDCGNAASVNLDTGTIEAWVKTSNAGGSYCGIILKQWEYSMFMQNNELGYYDWTAGWNGAGVYPNDDNWHHLVISFQSGVTDGNRIYVDGVLKRVSYWTRVPNSVPLLIGAGYPGGQLFNGYIDEAALYNRALTDGGCAIGQTCGGEIADHYNGGTGKNYCAAAVPKCTAGQTQSCYTGPSETEGVGSCQAGTQACENGAWGECTGEVVPTAEVCNSLDDNCNGDVDDIAEVNMPDCSKNEGECQGIKQVCSGGSWIDCTEDDYQAYSPYYSILEDNNVTCWDGYDNDCNGMADYDEPNCLPGGIPLRQCTLDEMLDLNNDDVVDSYDAIILMRQIITYPNQFVETKNCQAISVAAQ